ncbi:olfactory receptor 1G1-like [Cervus canadensis]|uniref:olfactory receptor 1G1-like n=1 Tax=Cervus canadensis TaxID=1574408 RepID=UPI001C9E54BF|nr:olfactory receptor 1G1-like [Cervus canadensis]
MRGHPVLGFITSLKAKAEGSVENGSQGTLPPAPSVTSSQPLCKNRASLSLVQWKSLFPESLSATSPCQSALLSLLLKEIRNRTSISDFLLLGFSQHPEQQPLLFGLFLAVYLVTMLGNLLIILAISSDPHLHTPMYFFLANLSLTDTCFSCTIIPKVLLNILTQHYTISYTGCLVQMFFFMELALLDDFLLAVMAYDRYVAICLPLHYTTIMGPQRCLLLVAASWLSSYLLAFSLCLLMSQFSFCASHCIPHFFCDLLPLLKLACSDTHIFQLMMFAEAALSGVVPLTCVLVSYAHIIHTILRIPSAGGKHKVFSTCGSHLTVVTLFYGTVFLVYFQPSSSYSADTGMAASVVYTMVTPMLNPFIYSLRNSDMKGALWRLLGWGRCSSFTDEEMERPWKQPCASLCKGE